MVTIHGLTRGLARFGVVGLRGAHSARTAVHLMRLQSSGPGRSPEEKNGEQAETCGQFLSLSDRKLERRSHLDRTLEYRNQD